MNNTVAGIILKVHFGDESEVYSDRYLDEMLAGKWTKWDTPRKYKGLERPGRKLMLYDPIQKAVTVEVEIASVRKTDVDPEYPWTNEFVIGTLRIFEPPIPLSEIEIVPGFVGFGSERGSHRNMTHEQYESLIGQRLLTVTPV